MMTVRHAERHDCTHRFVALVVNPLSNVRRHGHGLVSAGRLVVAHVGLDVAVAHAHHARAQAAMSFSCVTMMIVLPAWFSSAAGAS